MTGARGPQASGDRLVEAGWLAAAVVSPLFFDVDTARTFEPDKAALVRTIATWVLVAWCLGSFAGGVPRGPRPALGALARPVTLFALVTGLSTALSLSPWTSWWGSYERLQGGYTTLAYLVLFAAIATHLRSPAQVERLAAALVLASVPVCAYGVLQRSGLDPIPWSDAVVGRVYSTLGAATFLGAYVAMLVPLTVALAWQRSRWRTGYALAAGLQLITLVLTRSRGPLLGLIAATVIVGLFALLEWRRAQDGRSWAWRAWLGAAAIVILAGLLLNVRGTPLDPLLDPIRATPYGKRLASITESDRGTGKIRLLVWEAALERVRDTTPIGARAEERDSLTALRPVIGYGPESMRLAFASVQPAELAHYEDRGKSADRAHNAGVEQLVTGGILGLVAYGYLMIAALFAILRPLGLASRGRPFAARLWGGSLLGGLLALALGRGLTYVPLGAPCGLLTGLALHALCHERTEAAVAGRAHQLLYGSLGLVLVEFVQSQFGFGVTATSVVFWCVLGLVVALARGTVEPATPEPAGLRLVPAALVLLVTVVLALQAFAPSLRGLSSLSELIDETRTAARSVVLWHAAVVLWGLLFAWSAVGRPRLGKRSWRGLFGVGAAALLTWFGNVQPIRADVFLESGNRYARAGQFTEAIAMHERALACDPRESRFSLALAKDFHRLASESGDPDAWSRGEASAMRARALAPYDADHAANLARFYLAWTLAGAQMKVERAIECFEETLSLAPQDVLVYKELAQAERAAGDFEVALARLETAVAIDPRYPPTWVLLGDTHAVLDHADAALDAHRTAMETRVRGIDGFATFADKDVDPRLAYYVGAGKLDEVLSILVDLRAQRPSDARVPWAFARALVVTERWSDALVHIARARALGITALGAARELASRYPVEAFLRDAEELAQHIRATEIDVRHGLAVELERAGDGTGAIAQLEEALELSPDDARTLGNLAVAHRRFGNLDRAITLAERALAAAPPSQSASWTRFLSEARAARGR